MNFNNIFCKNVTDNTVTKYKDFTLALENTVLGKL